MLQAQISLQKYKQYARISGYLLSKIHHYIEVLAKENCPDEMLDSEFKRTIMNFHKEFKEFKQDTKKNLKKT